MGQFKPMVKMMTTEPSVELKLKTGGSATFARMKAEGFPKMGDKKSVKKMEGGVMGALAGAMPMAPPMGAPGAARAMAAKRMARRAPGMAGKAAMPPMPARPAMKKGGEMETPKMHKAEMKAIKGVGKELETHENKSASRAHKGLKTGGIAKSTKPGAFKTGGVVDGQGGYKSGGIIKSTKGTSKVSTVHPDHNSAPTGDVKMGNAGGYKKGGAAKKHFATGGAVTDSGHAVAMSQGAKTPSSPVSINRLAGTFKKGGVVC
jgi:hypothetical protein